MLKFTLASLYPVLYGLERRRLVKGTWQEGGSAEPPAQALTIVTTG